MTPVGRHDAQPQPRQLLRRDRAGRLLHRARRARHRLHQRPAAAGRIYSYLDTQLSRLGGPNFHEIPINAPSRRCTTTSGTACTGRRSTAAASPTSRTRWAAAARSRRAPSGLHVASASRSRRATRCAASREKFADHYSQATLFWNSQTPVEQAHIVGAFRFELTQVQVPAIRERVVAQLANVVRGAGRGGRRRARDRALPEALPRLAKRPGRRSPYSPPLSLFARPGDGSIRDAPGRDPRRGRRRRRAPMRRCSGARGAAPCRGSSARLARSRHARRRPLASMAPSRPTPSVLFDAVVFPDGDEAVERSRARSRGRVRQDQYRHCKAMLVLGSGGDAPEEARHSSDAARRGR